MKRFLSTALVAMIIIRMTPPVLAARKNVTLSIPTMDCEVCPVTVKSALKKVHGVTGIDINPMKRIVLITFDDSKTNVAALQETTKMAGYPSQLVK